MRRVPVEHTASVLSGSHPRAFGRLHCAVEMKAEFPLPASATGVETWHCNTILCSTAIPVHLLRHSQNCGKLRTQDVLKPVTQRKKCSGPDRLRHFKPLTQVSAENPCDWSYGKHHQFFKCSPSPVRTIHLRAESCQWTTLLNNPPPRWWTSMVWPPWSLWLARCIAWPPEHLYNTEPRRKWSMVMRSWEENRKKFSPASPNWTFSPASPSLHPNFKPKFGGVKTG